MHTATLGHGECEVIISIEIHLLKLAVSQLRLASRNEVLIDKLCGSSSTVVYPDCIATYGEQQFI